MYKPDKEILEKYSDILVNFALHSGQGVKKDEVVQCVVPDIAKPILYTLQTSILEAGAIPFLRLIPTGIEKDFYKLANEKQLTFFPKKYIKSRIDLIDHSIGIIAEHDLHELEYTDPQKIVLAAEAKKKAKEWQMNKEYDGRFTWTLALYGTLAMAKESGINLKEYWQQIIKACYLDYDNPTAQWKTVFNKLNRIITLLNNLSINKLLIKGEGINLNIVLGEKRKWTGGSGRNIPSFEIFTSPDWRGVNGFFYSNQPLYKYGKLIEGIRLEFKKGRIIKASAKTNEKTIHAIIKRKNANKIGEFSLTDCRFSRITKFMANTLFDENIGGKYGNVHIAVGSSYKDTYNGDPKKVSQKQWSLLGFNDSGEHCDIISTTDRTVTAVCNNGVSKIIYTNGKFVI